MCIRVTVLYVSSRWFLLINKMIWIFSHEFPGVKSAHVSLFLCVQSLKSNCSQYPVLVQAEKRQQVQQTRPSGGQRNDDTSLSGANVVISRSCLFEPWRQKFSDLDHRWKVTSSISKHACSVFTALPLLKWVKCFLHVYARLGQAHLVLHVLSAPPFLNKPKFLEQAG